jgi:hypothetical protein
MPEGLRDDDVVAAYRRYYAAEKQGYWVGERWAGIEVKTDVGELSDVQRAWHAAMKGKGGFVAVVRDAGDIVPALAACDAGAVEWP